MASIISPRLQPLRLEHNRAVTTLPVISFVIEKEFDRRFAAPSRITTSRMFAVPEPEAYIASEMKEFDVPGLAIGIVEVVKFTRVCANDRPERRSVGSRAGVTPCHSRPRRGMGSPLCTLC